MARRKRSEDQSEAVATEEVATEHASGGGTTEEQGHEPPQVFDAAFHAHSTDGEATQQPEAQQIVQDVADSMAMPDETPEGWAGPNNPGAFKNQPGRGWASRHTLPVRFRMWEQKNEKNEDVYLLKFELPKGMAKPPEEVVEVLQSHKYYKDGKPVGTTEDIHKDPEAFRTGLHWRDDRHFQKTWELPKDHVGKQVAFDLAAELNKVAEQIEARGR